MKSLFGQRVKKLRLERNLSQQELADNFHLTRTAVTDWETRSKEPSFGMLMDIAKFFNVTTDYLLGLVDEM